MASGRTCCSGSDDSTEDVACRKRKSWRNLKLVTNEKDYRLKLQGVMHDREYVVTKIFRKDGQPAGDQFDSPPSNAFLSDSGTSDCQENRLGCETDKVSMPTFPDNEACVSNNSIVRHGRGTGPMTAKCAPFKKHGMDKGLVSQIPAPRRKHGIGKDLMTLVANRGTRNGIGKGLMTLMTMRPEKRGTGKGFMMFYPGKNSCLMDGPYGVDCNASSLKKMKKPQRESVVRKLARKELAKRRSVVRNNKSKCQKLAKKKKLHLEEKCELASDLKNIVNVEQFSMLEDDEELELRELQTRKKVLPCFAHFPTSGSHGCSLCKGLLAKFPPSSVVMKQPLSMQPWSSSPELTNKLFKAFHFLCTYAVTIGIPSFTLDHFAKAFHDKNSLLLGKIHAALLRVLFLDVEKELRGEVFPRAIKNCKFLNLLHSHRHNDCILEFWKNSLNHLTWCEILRQVFIKAGFGSKLDVAHKEVCGKKVSLMDKYSLSPGTLKGELFCLLVNKGKSGMGVSDLARSPSIVQLNLTDTMNDLEDLISKTLSGDIKLFEKIFSSGYRVRTHAVEREMEVCLSDSEELGSGDDISEVTGGNDANGAEHDSGASSTIDPANLAISTSIAHNEIDESYTGEAWLLGLSEGEYCDLSIGDKLNALVSLIDLLSAGSGIRIEDPATSSLQRSPSNRHGSGAKLKVSTAKQSNSLEDEEHAIMKRIGLDMDLEEYLHPMQSVFLGSDRRYNRYWLFLGPCDRFDPGHRRIYFESSEDGHWQIIDTSEALSALFLALDNRGSREAHLLASLRVAKELLIEAMSNRPNCLCGNRQLVHSDDSEINIFWEDSSSPVSDVQNLSSSSEMQNENSSFSDASVGETELRRQQQMYEPVNSRAFDACIWKSFYHELAAVKRGKKSHLASLRRCDQCHDLYWSDEKHCRICHTTFELDFDLEERYAVHSAVCRTNFDIKKCRRQRVLSSQLQALKAAIYAIELAMPEDAFSGSWRRSVHKIWVNRLRRASNLKEFLQVLADFVAAINEEFFHVNNFVVSRCNLNEILSSFSTVPHTYSAVALWLVKVDTLTASLGERTTSKES